MRGAEPSRAAGTDAASTAISPMSCADALGDDANDLTGLQALCESRGLALQRIEGKLALTQGELSICGDFSHMLPRLKQNKLSQELLVKAAKIKGASSIPGTLRTVDCTAGLGEDSLLLAAAGFRVDLFEHNPVIAALLQDALDRASCDATIAPIVSRMTLHRADSVYELPNLDFEPDVVFLDPMFPERRKSASVKKKLQLLQKLEQPCATEDELLNAALAAHPRKVVIKRPPKGPYLAGRKPSYSLAGKAVRYDVMALAR